MSPLDEANHILGLVMRRYNQILCTLQRADDLGPLFYEWEHDGEVHVSGDEWYAGFGLGIGLRVEDWSPLFEDKDAAILLGPIMWLSSEETRKETGSDDDPEAYSETLDLVSLAVPAIYDYWEPQQKKRASEFRRESFTVGCKPRVGRNDPRPCGSGKKFKKCCGSGRA